eukprot:gene25847-biopygen9364
MSFVETMCVTYIGCPSTPEDCSLSGLLNGTKTAPIELRVEAHHLRFAKMVYLNSQFDRILVPLLAETKA